MTSQTALFIVGPPGVGKTSIARALIGFPDVLVTCSAPRWTLAADETIAAAGHYTGAAFDGADTVGYSGVAAALDFWERDLYDVPLTIFDGDRFSYAGALARVRRVARPLCLALVASSAELEARRAQRGSAQSAAWMRGRATKAKRFAALFSGGEVFDATVDGQSAAGLAALVRAWIAGGSP